MNRVPVVARFTLALLVLAATSGLLSCSHGEGVTTPSTTPGLTADTALPDSPSGDGVTLGYFEFIWDDDGAVRVEEATPSRGLELNVTNYASIVIEDFHFNEEQRNWYITATVKNISPYTGYDVWAVFHSLGAKFLVNQDGFLWALPPIFPEPTRCAFIAYGKDQPMRVYPPMYQDTRTIIIHQPEGVPKLTPIGFWIDAMIHPRPTPGVEDLMVEPLDDSPDNTDYVLTGYVWDHQSPSGELTVWADCTGFNGQNYVQLFDDGEHGDGQAGDDIFGAYFSGDPEEGFYVITVFAFDPQGNQGENDVGFWHGEGPCNLPKIHLPFETIDKGEQSGIQEEFTAVINNWHTWEDIWAEHTSWIYPPPPIPPIDFEHNTVIGVWIGARPSNNHVATITQIFLDPCEDLVTVRYDYTPYIGCGPLDVMTYPFHIVILPKIQLPVFFAGTEIPCPGPPPDCVEHIPYETIIHGAYSGIKEPYELRIKNWQQFEMLWDAHTSNMWPPPPPPEINFEYHDLIAVGIGERPTGGFECNIEEICRLMNEHVGVFYVERIPGPGCQVTQAFTQPHHWVVMPKADAPVEYFKRTEVYNCGHPDCEEPLMFWPIDEGHQTGHEPGEFVFTNQYDFHAFWQVHKPDAPIPPVHWEEEMVLAMLIGDRPTSGFYVETIEVCLNGINDPGQPPHLDVTYVEFIPGENCEVWPVVTKPFQIIIVPRFDLPVFFHPEEEVYECPPCAEVPWYQLADGDWSCAEAGEYGFQGFGPAFTELWHAIHCWDPVELPKIPDPIEGGEMKPFVVQLGERPTTGWYVTIDAVCLDGCDAWVEYTEWVPGPDCNVDQVVTKPWAFGVAEFPPIDCEIQWHFVANEEVYSCQDCYPTDFHQIAEGNHSCAEPGEYGWQHMDPYIEFWYAVNCYDPSSGDPPPPLPEEPPPWEDWIMHHIGIQLPERPSTGYYITVDEVCFEGCDVYIDYTEWIPGQDCEVLWVITKPWAIAAVELPPVFCYWSWHFEKHEQVYECPDEPCYDFDQVAGSNNHGGEEQGGWFFDNADDYMDYWLTYHASDPPPTINFDGGWGGYAIHLGSRPTTGFEVEVFEICDSEDPFGVAVRWVEWIPGETCDVLQIETGPWTLVTFPLVDLPYFDQGFEEVYQCD